MAQANVKRKANGRDGVWVDGIYVDRRNFNTVEAIMRISEHVRPTNILVVGPSGYGKTSLAQAAAAAHGLKYLRMNCAQVRDPEEWFGYREARQGSTEFVRSRMIEVVQRGDAVICLDEFNRVEPWLSNTLYPLLDHDRATIIHNETIKVGPNTTFFATVNLGYQYVGAFTLDAAIINRMDATVKVSALPTDVEVQLVRARTGCTLKDAKLVVAVVHKARSLCESSRILADMSTRTSLKVALMVAAGKLTLAEAFTSVVINALQSDDAKRVVDTVSDMLVEKDDTHGGIGDGETKEA